MGAGASYAVVGDASGHSARRARACSGYGVRKAAGSIVAELITALVSEWLGPSTGLAMRSIFCAPKLMEGCSITGAVPAISSRA